MKTYKDINMSDQLLSTEITKDKNKKNDQFMLDMEKRKRQKIKEVEELFTSLINQTNAMNQEEQVVDGLINTLKKEHPTLVQSFFRCLAKASSKTKDLPRYQTDLRAQGTGKILKILSENENSFPFI